jgi:hypothetical protein
MLLLLQLQSGPKTSSAHNFELKKAKIWILVGKCEDWRRRRRRRYTYFLTAEQHGSAYITYYQTQQPSWLKW